MRRDIYSNIGAVLALAPAVQSASINGVAIDTKDFGSVAVVLNTGAIASAGDFSAKLQESDTTTDGDFTDVAAAQVQTNAPATLAASSTYKLGYLGNKRYCRLVLTKAGGTSIAAGAAAVKGHAADTPVA
jgi:hypothetical protein